MLNIDIHRVRIEPALESRAARWTVDRGCLGRLDTAKTTPIRIASGSAQQADSRIRVRGDKPSPSVLWEQRDVTTRKDASTMEDRMNTCAFASAANDEARRCDGIAAQGALAGGTALTLPVRIVSPARSAGRPVALLETVGPEFRANDYKGLAGK